MPIEPMPPYYLIRIIKAEQKDRQGKHGSIVIPPSFVFGTRGVQSGQIVKIGALAAKDIPEAKVGNILLFHHFVEFKEKEGTADGRYLVDSDEMFNYYTVSSRSQNGRANETYGVFNGAQIITHPEYVLLEPDQPEEAIPYHDVMNIKMKMTEGGILVFKQWRINRDEQTEKAKRLQQRVKSLSGLGMTREIIEEIQKVEKELEFITKRSNRKTYDRYTVVCSNPRSKIFPGDTVYALNAAVLTKIEFMKKEFRVCKNHFIIGVIREPRRILQAS